MSTSSQIRSGSPDKPEAPDISAATAGPKGSSADPRCSAPEQHILLVRLGGFGDVVFTLPAVHLLRKAFPTARITFLVYKELQALLQGFNGVDSVLTLDRARFRTLNPFTVCVEAASLLGKLTRNRFTLTVDFQGFGETALFSWCTRAPNRWGSVYRPGRKWAYTQAVSRNPKLHPIDYHLDLLRQAGALVPERIHNEFVPPEETLREAGRFFASHNLDPNRPTVFIQPFTSSEAKTWPLQSFIAIARQMRQRGLQVLFGGGPAEQPALQPVRADGFAVSAGAPPLLSAGLVKLSTLVLGGDTGLLHLAVALGKRVVIIMRSVQPGACIPFGHPEWVVAAPSPALPVAAISADAVQRACTQALAELDPGEQTACPP